MKMTRILLLSVALAGTAVAQSVETPAADNSAVNERDQSDKNLTSDDQSNAAPDIKLAAEVRQAVITAEGLSMTAKNCKIIALDGTVTLRGPVNSPEEKAKIEELATSNGATTVVNELEVKAEG